MNIEKISIVFAIVGILLLFILSLTSIEKTNINEITKKQLNEKLTICGKVISEKDYEDSNFKVLTIQQGNSTIQAITNNIQIKLENKKVEITGRLEEYNNNLQINIEKLKVVDGC